jgi:hypothetical protein
MIVVNVRLNYDGQNVQYFVSQDNNFASGISSRTFERWNILYPQMPKMKVETVSVKIMLIFEVVNKSTLTHFILVPSFLLKCTVVTPHRCRSSWWYSYSDYDHWKNSQNNYQRWTRLTGIGDNVSDFYVDGTEWMRRQTCQRCLSL